MSTTFFINKAEVSAVRLAVRGGGALTRVLKVEDWCSGTRNTVFFARVMQEEKEDSRD